MLLVVDPSCTDYAGAIGLVIPSQLMISSFLFSGNCLTGQLLGHVLEVLVAVTIGSDQSSGLGITYESARISQPFTSKQNTATWYHTDVLQKSNKIPC